MNGYQPCLLDWHRTRRERGTVSAPSDRPDIGEAETGEDEGERADEQESTNG